MEVTEELQQIAKLISDAKVKLESTKDSLPSDDCNVKELFALLDDSAECVSEITELIQLVEQR